MSFQLISIDARNTEGLRFYRRRIYPFAILIFLVPFRLELAITDGNARHTTNAKYLLQSTSGAETGMSGGEAGTWCKVPDSGPGYAPVHPKDVASPARPNKYGSAPSPRTESGQAANSLPALGKSKYIHTKCLPTWGSSAHDVQNGLGSADAISHPYPNCPVPGHLHVMVSAWRLASRCLTNMSSNPTSCLVSYPSITGCITFLNLKASC